METFLTILAIVGLVILGFAVLGLGLSLTILIIIKVLKFFGEDV